MSRKATLAMLLLGGCKPDLALPAERPQAAPVAVAEVEILPPPVELEPPVGEPLELGEPVPCKRRKPGMNYRWRVGDDIIQPVDWIHADFTGDGKPEFLGNVEMSFGCSRLYLKRDGEPEPQMVSWGCTRTPDDRRVGPFVFLGCYDSDQDGKLEVLIEDGPHRARTQMLLEWDGSALSPHQ
jgi:hypothetical protein